MNDRADDEPRKPVKQPAHELGQDLSALSVHELQERIAALRAEIARLEQALNSKSASRAAAELVFRF